MTANMIGLYIDVYVNLKDIFNSHLFSIHRYQGNESYTRKFDQIVLNFTVLDP